MPVHNTVEEREIIKLVEKMPVADEQKQAWIGQIRESGMSEDLGKAIQQHLSEHGENDPDFPNRARMLRQLSSLIRSWRLTLQKKVFKR